MRQSVEHYGPQHVPINFLIDETTIMRVCPEYEMRRFMFMADFLKAHGRMFPRASFDDRYPSMGIGGRCFDQAVQLMSMTGLTYCEGVMLITPPSGEVFPMPHAWCCTPDGNVIDPTCPKLQSHPRIRYYGISFRHSYVAEHLRRWGFNGLLDGHPEYGDTVGPYADPVEKWKF